ncbi:hypothetical protein [Novosphingobium sp. B1]|uniref:hypothetical protein n=1 Tax=Novosphingobium sp. B1 TaxID=1938756 RepID=UPI0009D81931|nr:hypothetical protein [Novosphingobium sp. B1]SMD06951.1 hypothetical protein SAMN06272759_13314 [Novosphingobium sp. B1]
MTKNAPALQAGVSIALFCTLIIACFNAWSEFQVSRLSAQRSRINQAPLSRGDYYELLSSQSYISSARGALLAGSMLSHASEKARGNEAIIYGDSARAYLDQAEIQRPGWAQVTLARIYASRTAAAANKFGTTGSLLRLSYQQAPFLTSEGPWRVNQVLGHWNETDESTRKSAAAEAVYLSSLSRANRVHMRLIYSHTPLAPYVAAAQKAY